MNTHRNIKIVVVGSLRNVQHRPDICEQFVIKLGELIVERDHTLLTGCRGSLDKAIAESANHRLALLRRHDQAQLVSYRLRDAEPAFRCGRILVSSLTDWELNHPELTAPEQIASANVGVFIAGNQGTFIAANWARIVGLPVLGVAQFGGAARSLYESEYNKFQQKYARAITLEDFQVLSEDTEDTDRLAQNVLSLAEHIVMPNTVFCVMPYTSPFRDVVASYRDVCKQFGFEAFRIDDVEINERIVQRIIDGIRTCAFVIADVSEVKPNVYYELGVAEGFGKQVVVTANKGTTLPFDISDVPVILWDCHEDLKKQLRRRIRATAASLVSKMSPSVAMAASA